MSENFKLFSGARRANDSFQTFSPVSSTLNRSYPFLKEHKEDKFRIDRASRKNLNRDRVEDYCSFARASVCGSFNCLNSGVQLSDSDSVDIVRNPHKAILTVESSTHRILTCNDMACRLFCVSSKAELIGHTWSGINELIKLFIEERIAPDLHELPLVLEVEVDSAQSSTSHLRPLKGVVTEVSDNAGNRVPVAAWASCIRCDRWLFVLEPVERIRAVCEFDRNSGVLFTCDDSFAQVFRYSEAKHLFGCKIRELIPHLKHDCFSDQHLTGTTKCDQRFPLVAKLTFCDDNESCEQKLQLVVDVYLTVSGLITLNSKFQIQSYNQQFISILFGYDEKQILNNDIACIIPNFRHDVFASQGCNVRAENAEPSSEDDVERLPEKLESMRLFNLDVTPSHSNHSSPFGKRLFANLTSTPLSPLESYRHIEDDGCYWSEGLHRDGNRIAIGYQVRKIGEDLICVWVVRDKQSEKDHLSPSDDVGDSELLEGDYVRKYYTLHQIGKGAFGLVKLAARRTDGLLAVVKLIVKDKVLQDCWIQGEPAEVHMLKKLDHPNIVKVIEILESERYFYLVMEKCGSGIDLFEFIERQANVDECLASYIFRQIVAAVAYLHSCGIVHRDVKDENVIIDQNFICKLIDFGSAAYMEPGNRFSTFVGTVEYSSPEVLLGDGYYGPELEVWCLGVLLYTLIFKENPFFDATEIVQAKLYFPEDVSDGLHNLLSWCLHPSPSYRASIKEIAHHFWLQQPIQLELYEFERVLNVKDDSEISPPKYLKEIIPDEELAKEMCQLR